MIYSIKESRKITERLLPRLKRHGIKPYLVQEIESHGPHPGQEYAVFILNTKSHGLITVSPRAIYEIDTESDWWKTEKDGAERIPCVYRGDF